MEAVRVDEEGNLRCWSCGGKHFVSKRSGRGFAIARESLSPAPGTTKKLRCQCGEFNEVGLDVASSRSASGTAVEASRLTNDLQLPSGLRATSAVRNRWAWVITASAVGLLAVVGFIQSATEPEPSIAARLLTFQEAFGVESRAAVEHDGYEITSQVCEAVSTRGWRTESSSVKLVFHAFRIEDSPEQVVLFASDRTGQQGDGYVAPVNQAAIDLHQGFPPGHRAVDPITVNSPGAEEAMACAETAGPPLQGMEGFDVEAWRDEAIALYGPEATYSDGSKQDYVSLGYEICRFVEDRPEQRYEAGSIQRFIITDFCPHIE